VNRAGAPSALEGDGYKWVALSNTTLGVLLATIDASITLIAMPDIFRGIHLDPLGPGNSFYLLWMILGFLVVTSVLVVSLGRLGDLFSGATLLVVFAVLERRVVEPMFRLPLFRIRAFTFGVMSSFLSAVARGGLMFMLIIWLQGIWLPRHGYSFTETPLWAGIYMLPLTLGFLIAGPASGYLSDRYGARPFATGGMLAAAVSFLLLEPLHRPAGPRRVREPGLKGRPPAPGLDPVRGLSRLQPDPEAARHARAQPTLARQRRHRHGALVLPAADLQPVPLGPARRVRLRDHRLPARGGRLLVARQPLRRR